MIMMMLVLQDGDVIQYTINVRKLEEDTEDNNIITLVRQLSIHPTEGKKLFFFPSKFTASLISKPYAR